MTKDFNNPPVNGEQKPFSVAAPAEQQAFWPWPFWCQPNGDRNPGMFHTFDGIQPGFYPTATPQRWNPQDYQDMKTWATAENAIYNFPFQPQPESYPVDPCPSLPSTSVAQSPLDYKMNPAAAYYPNPLLTASYAQPDYQMAITAGWKMAAKAPSASKAGIPVVPHRTGPGTNNVRVRTSEKYRAVYTDTQRTELEVEFATSAFITADRKAEIAGRLNLTERQVKIWFQNRRAKDRRDKKK